MVKVILYVVLYVEYVIMRICVENDGLERDKGI